MNNISFDLENDELLKKLLELRFFSFWKMPPEFDFHSVKDNTNLELVITSSCNQKCTYCYLAKYENELYPPEINKKDIIINNLYHVLDWIKENNFSLYTLSLFSGEIWHTDFGLKILDIIVNYIIDNDLPIKIISIPTNGTFILNDIQTKKIEKYIYELQAHDRILEFSFSLDGKIIEDLSRPLNTFENRIDLDNFYDKVFIFAKRHNYFFHPMVAASNVKYWCENWEWWESKCEEYNFDIFEALMLLEVRNDDWTNESIDDLKQFCDFLIEKNISKKYNNNLYDFFLHVLSLDTDEKIGYTPDKIGSFPNFLACTAYSDLVIRLGDLAICPCHRQMYKNYIIGYLTQDEQGKINNVKASNIYMAIHNWLGSSIACHPNCINCPCQPICPKQCQGSCLESNNDPYVLCSSVCQMYQQKFYHICTRLVELGIIDFINTTLTYDRVETQENVDRFLSVLNNFQIKGE